MAVTRGKDFKFYRDTNSPPTVTPTWVLIANCRDLTRNAETSLADASVRGSTFKQQVSTLKDLSVDFQMVYDGGADFTAFEDAFFTDGVIQVLLLDGPIATVGSKGLQFMAQVSKFTGNEALEDVGLNDVTIVPAYDPVNLPKRVHVVTGGTITPVP